METAWFTLYGKVDIVEIAKGAHIWQFRDAVKARCQNLLRHVNALSLQVFAAGGDPRKDAPLDPGGYIPTNTTSKEPLIVIVQEAVHEPLIKRAKNTFDVDSLLEPLQVKPPKTDNPEFIRSEHWLSEVHAEIKRQLLSSDASSDELDRVPPMAIVRCSRGGKTRALYEIANLMHGRKIDGIGEIATIYVSFNDYMSIRISEQHDPLQALCRRIAFMASRDRRNDEDKCQQFDEFLSDDPVITPDDIKKWLGDTPAILLIDELNNLDELTKNNSVAAEEFGRFIKTSFLAMKGRHFVFSSHVLTTLGFFGEFIDPSLASCRTVTLQELPLVDNLSIVMKKLNPSLNGAREATYYGLMPGMIYETTQRIMAIAGKREAAVETFLSQSVDRVTDFKNILQSLITGSLGAVPAPLHILLDAYRESESNEIENELIKIELGSNKIRWVPYHLQYVMRELRRTNATFPANYCYLASVLEGLCRQLLEAKESSGDGWEGLFVLFLLARCITAVPDETFVPSQWFSKSLPHVCYNSPYNHPRRCISDCKNWKELSEGLVLEDKPQLSIFYPPHARFEAYDAIVVYTSEGTVQCVYGYQLKEGRAASKQPVEETFIKSFVVKGNPPHSSTDSNKWYIPCGADIDSFFGESGKYWTPQQWQRLSASVTGDESQRATAS